MKKIDDTEFVSKCEFCGSPLLQDEVYGTDDIDLCHKDHVRFFDLLKFMITGQLPLKLEAPHD